MVTAYDVPANDLIAAAKEELKKNAAIKPPEWSQYAKSGAHKDRPPEQLDFWYIRSAALLRKLYVHDNYGVSRLRTEYGGKKNRGSKPEKHFPASGSVIRKILQQLEAAGYVAKDKRGKGRVLTPAGKKFLDSTAKQAASMPKKENAAEAPKEKPKKEKVEEKKEEKAPEAPKEEKPAEKQVEEPKPEQVKEEKAPKEEKPAEEPKEKKPAEESEKKE